MKRVGYIYESIIDVENCKQAIIRASKGKRNRKNVQNILNDVDHYALELSDRLQSLHFTTPYRKKVINDGLSHKERTIYIPAFFPDQCAQHAIMLVCEPYFIKKSYFWSCANIKGRGMKRADIGVRRALKKFPNQHCLKMDVHHFYPTVPHDKLKERLQHIFKDRRALELFYCIIDSHDEGVPIGNYTSAWFAEIFLQPMDYFINQTLHIKKYIRYADDIVMIGGQYQLNQIKPKILEYVKGLGVEIKKNYQLFRIKNAYGDNRGRGIDFIGNVYCLGYTKVRKRKALAFMRQSRRIRECQESKTMITFKTASGFISRCNLFKNTNSSYFRKKYLDGIKFGYLKYVVREFSRGHEIKYC